MAINAERAAQDVTLRQLSESSGIADRVLFRALKSERTLGVDQLEQIARALGVSVPQIVTDAERYRTREVNQ